MCANAPDRHTPSIVDPTTREGGLDAGAGPNRLLVIDDEAGIARAIALIARELEFEVQVVNVPSRALEAFLAFRPHIAMIDMIMPEKDGIDVLNEILLTGIPVHAVLMSGFSDNYLRLAEGVAQFHDATRYSVLRKPFRRNELVTTLSRLVSVDV
jgi:two-component system KDP operon response regulator KdpE